MTKQRYPFFLRLREQSIYYSARLEQLSAVYQRGVDTSGISAGSRRDASAPSKLIRCRCYYTVSTPLVSSVYLACSHNSLYFLFEFPSVLRRSYDLNSFLGGFLLISLAILLISRMVLGILCMTTLHLISWEFRVVSNPALKVLGVAFLHS